METQLVDDALEAVRALKPSLVEWKHPILEHEESIEEP